MANKNIQVAYVCDKKACNGGCPGRLDPDYPCRHTTDIEHAVNFMRVSDDKYFECDQVSENGEKDD